jgi:hypothetical protein
MFSTQLTQAFAFQWKNQIQLLFKYVIPAMLLFISVQVNGQTPTLEMYSGAGNPTGNGPTTAAQTITLQKNTDNPGANTIGAYSPLVTVRYTLSNQQFAFIEGNPTIAGVQFGGSTQIGGDGLNSPVPGMAIYNLMNGIGGSANAQYTSCNTCTSGTGIDIAANRSVEFLTYGDALISPTGTQNFPVNARVQFADVTFTFSQPVSNPVMHLTGMGGNFAYGTTISSVVTNYTIGFTSEFDMVTPGLTFTRLSGSTYFNVTASSITNTATKFGGATGGAVVNGLTRYAASGTVRVNATNITSFTIRIFLKGDGGAITNSSGAITSATNGNIVRWAPHENFVPGGVTGITEGTTGDAFLVGFSLPAPVAVSGNVFNDINGGNVNNSTAGANAVPSGIYANLVDAGGNVVTSVPVNTNGTYNFSSVYAGNYTVSLSTVPGEQGSPAPPVSLPSGWVSTGEFNGTPDTGNDGTINGISASFTVGATNVTNVNFGIQQPPTPGIFTAATQVNPGGTTNATVAATAFSGTDASGGIITSLRITAFPSNATTIIINGTSYTSATFPVGGVTVPTNASGQPTQTISVDPVDGNVTVSIPYRVTDNAGAESTTTGVVNLPFTTISLNGNVFNDVGGLVANANVDGTGIGSPSGTQLYANLISGGVVVGAVPVEANGTYSFPSVSPNTSYNIQLSTNQGTVGIAPPAIALPANWVNTGEDCCDNIGSDGTVNGAVTVTTGTSNVTNANFGIEQLPNSGVNTQPNQTNPGGTTQVTVPAAAFSGTDADGGIVSFIRITAFPSDAQSIVINGTSYTSGTFPVGGVTIPTNASGQPTQTITVDPLGNGAGANRTVVIPYATIDNAGKEDPTPGSVTMPFVSNAWTVNGNVFNDIDALTDGTVNGAGVGLPSGIQLYAYLRTTGNATILQAVPVNSDGTYSFTEVGNGTYTVVISTTQVAVGGTTPAPALPTNWVNTGENLGAGAGNDGTINGTLNFTMASANVSNVNFGIEQLPNTGVNTQPSQLNPGGTANVTVPAAAFSASDPDGGIVTGIRITSFPTNATSITINSVQYTTLTAINAAYPNGIPVNVSGQPTQTISVDPADGNVNVVIEYAAIDNAGQQDSTPGSVTLPFFNVSLSGTVFNDLNGLTNNTVDGSGTGLPSGTQLYANLLNAAGTTVIASVSVNGDGTYQFNNIPGNTNYVVQISTNQGTATQPAPVTVLPVNWVHTGEDCCDNTGSDGTTNGLLPVSVLAANVTNANFGIEQLPNSGTNTQPLQPNPPGAANVTVPAGAFSGTDPDGGTVTFIRITAFPTNAASITINGITYNSATFPAAGVTVPTNASGQPTQTIKVDPVDGLISVVIPYASIDNAGKEDATPGSVTLPFTNISISGNVLNDANGLVNANVDGAGIGSPNGTQLHANLLDATGTTVVATVPVNPDGTYNFYGVPSNTNYVVQLSTNQGTAGQPAPVVALPTGWVNTGEDCCDNNGSDGTVNGLVSVAVTGTSVTNANFGINHRPAGTDITAVPQLNPGGFIQVPVPPLAGSDPEDGTLGNGATVRIDALPTNAILYYDADGPGGAAPVAVTAGQVISNYNSALLTIDPNPNDASQPALLATFQYSFADAAGVYDPVPNTVNMQFLTPVAIIGTVFNDVNGSANNTHQTIQDGAETGTNATGQLYAYVVDQSTGLIVQKDTVNADGTWSFSGLNAAGTVRVIITGTNTDVGLTPPALTLPAGWVNTSPLDTIIVYNNPPGFLITNVNFGIEELPESFNSAQPVQGNPGGTTSVAVSPESFYGEDVVIGMVTSIRITSFPTNATSITINGVTYTSATFPGGGVIVPANSSGQPTQSISIDPIDGNVTVSITYTVIDNANREDPTSAIVLLPFSTTLPVNTIELSGSYRSEMAGLNWFTKGETGVFAYEVERSENAIQFVKIDQLNSKGDGDHQYQLTDRLTGYRQTAVYYRIKVVDQNGQLRYSNILKLSLSGLKKVELLPNPFVNAVNIQISAVQDGTAILRLLTSDGKEILKQTRSITSGNNSILLDNLGELAKGIYVIEIIVNNVRITQTLVKQ